MVTRDMMGRDMVRRDMVMREQTTLAFHATPPYRRRGAELDIPLLPEGEPGFPS